MAPVAGGVLPAAAQNAKVLAKDAANDTADIEDCLKSKPDAQESCIGIVSDPCLDRDSTKSTADQNACINREFAVWDDILNETFGGCATSSTMRRRPSCATCSAPGSRRRKRPARSIGITIRAPMASPMAAACVNKETARRALFLIGFMLDAEGK